MLVTARRLNIGETTVENKRGLVGAVYVCSGSNRHIHILQYVLGQNSFWKHNTGIIRHMTSQSTWCVHLHYMFVHK